MKKLERQFNQFFKNMGFITYGDNTMINMFRAMFWITVIGLGVYGMIQLAWVIEYIQPGIWQ
jgi:hypothetical protein